MRKWSNSIGVSVMGVLLVFVLAFDVFAAEAAYPERNLTVYVPTKEGGSMDRVVRAFGSVWSKYLGVNLEPVFYGGAGGEIAFDLWLNESADGYAILAGNLPQLAIMYALQNPKTSYDDFRFFAAIDADPNTIWVPKNSPFQTIQDLIDEAKRRTVTVSTPKYPHPSTLAAMILAAKTGADLNIVAYGGGAASRTAGVTGETDCATGFLSSSLDLSDDIRYLLMFNDKNHWPDISDNAPTPEEAFGISIPSIGANRGWAVQREFIENYPERYKFLVETLEATMKDPELAEAIEKTGLDPQFLMYLDAEGSEKLGEGALKQTEVYKDLLLGAH